MLAQYRTLGYENFNLEYNEKRIKIEFLNVSILVDEPEGFLGMGICWSHALQTVPEKSDLN